MLIAQVMKQGGPAALFLFFSFFLFFSLLSCLRPARTEADAPVNTERFFFSAFSFALFSSSAAPPQGDEGIVRFIEINHTTFLCILSICLIIDMSLSISCKGGISMSITATELKNHLGKYLLLAATEDVFITRNGKTIAKLSNPNQDRVNIAKSLFGILPNDMTLEESKEERLDQI